MVVPLNSIINFTNLFIGFCFINNNNKNHNQQKFNFFVLIRKVKFY
jgi:hypothetical protein